MYSNPNDGDADKDGLDDCYDPNPQNIVNNSSAYIGYMTSQQISDMQKWLESLGYLDMQGNEYGTYGALTRTAVCLYQINHGFQPSRYMPQTYCSNTGYVSVVNVDSATFFTIANEYYNTFGNGKEDYYNYIHSLMEDDNNATIVNQLSLFQFKEYFVDTPRCRPILTESQVENGIIISEISNAMIYDWNYVQSSRYCDLYTYDYTDIIDNTFHEIVADKVSIIDFYNNVKPNGCWDVKTPIGWNSTFAVEKQEGFISYNFPFIYRSLCCTPEQLGNIMYGYMGKYVGFSEEILLNAGSIVSIITSGKPDNDKDKYAIKLGVRYYEQEYR